ncbi:S-layer homology domain-containing protein [Agathobaculum sp. NTUH-O15-33]|uniref:S-layer homology domain-containing protein n=1 Tax=Agathobaculum sp. NTUH-O15-33 TaxID=3079302 RepID=UPI0029584386|nr:S-layer homology domain-containing protein [Agathobaculum sp. NTUH-O15-33]WNX83349.1 S-layer homology domain-containing protein [Agathobaculum sp. NTUH-O15-33]
MPPSEEGTYTLSGVTEDTEVTIEPIRPAGNAIMPIADKVTVTLPKNDEVFTITADGYGSPAVSGNQQKYSITKGEHFTFNVKLQDAYTQTNMKVLAGGSEIFGTAPDIKTYTISGVQSNTVVEIQPGNGSIWTKNTYNVTIPKSGKGYRLTQVTVGSASTSVIDTSGSYIAKATHGNKIIFTIALETGYTEATPQASYGGKKLTGVKNTGNSTVTYTIDAVTSEISVSITDAAANRHTVTFPTDQTGFTVASVDGTMMVDHNGTYQFYVHVADGYTGTPIVRGIITTDAGQTTKNADHTSNTHLYSISGVNGDMTIEVTGISPSKCTVNWLDQTTYKFKVPGAIGNSITVSAGTKLSFQLELDESVDPDNIVVIADMETLTGTPEADNPYLLNFTLEVKTNVKLEVENAAGKTYAITWHVDGRETKTTCAHGDIPKFSGSTAKVSSGGMDYTFVGWAYGGTGTPSTDAADYKNGSSTGGASLVGKDAPLPAAIEARDYYAVYSAEKQTYMVTWIVDGQVSTTQVTYGDVPAFSGAEPTKAQDSQNTYTFKGWTMAGGDGTLYGKGNAFPAVTGAVTYIAEFEAAARTFTLTVQYEKEEDLRLNMDSYVTTTQQFAAGASYTVTNPTAVAGYSWRSDHPLTGTMPATNMTIVITFYAKTDTAYQVKHYKGSISAGNLVRTDNLKGTTDSTVTPSTIVMDGYDAPTSITGTKIDADGSTVIALIYTPHKYTVTWDANGGSLKNDSSNDVAILTRQVAYGDKITVPNSPTRSEDENNRYAFKEWTGYTADMTMPAKDMTFLAEWTPTAREYAVTVKYVLASDSTQAAADGTVTKKVGEAYSIASPAVTGYTPAQAVVAGKMPAGGATVTVKYFPNTATTYKAEYYFQPASGSTDLNQFEKNTTLAPDETLSGTTGVKTNVVAKPVDGFKAQTVTQQTINAEGNTVVKVYYDRQTYTITWDAGQGAFGDGSSFALQKNVMYGSTVLDYDAPTRKADNANSYTFSKWADHDSTMPAQNITVRAEWTAIPLTYTLTINYILPSGTQGDIKNPDPTVIAGKKAGEKVVFENVPVVTGYTPSQSPVTVTMPAQDVTVTVNYFPDTDTAYKVEHYLQKADGSGYEESPADTDNMTGTTDSDTAAAAKSYDGFALKGSIVQEKIKADGSTAIKVYYDRKKYTMTWDLIDGTWTNGSTQTTTEVTFGQKIVPPDSSSATGKTSDPNSKYTTYTWKDYSDDTTLSQPQNKTFQAQWTTEKQTYTLHVVCKMPDGFGGDTPTVDDQACSYGVKYSVSMPPRDGYFPAQAILTGTMPAENLTVEVPYYPDTSVKYTVKHHLADLEGGTYTEEEKARETRGGVTGQQTAATAKSFEGFVLRGGGIQNKTIAADGSTVVDVYYDRVEYDVTWDAGTGTFAGSEPIKKTKVKFGAKIPKLEDVPRKNQDSQYSYQFKEWTGWTADDIMTASGKSYQAAYNSTELQYTLTLAYEKSDTGLSLDLPAGTSKQLAYNAAYDFTADANKPEEKPGYHWVADHPLTGKMPAESLTITVTYYPNTNTKYVVKHALQSVTDDNGYEEQAGDEQTYSGVTDSEVTPAPRTYTGFTAQSVQAEKISPNGDTVITIKYNRNSYPVIWNANGGYFGEKTADKKTYTQQVKYGGVIEMPTAADYTSLSRDSDAQHAYTFADTWEGYDAANKPTMDTVAGKTYYANWNETAVEYKLTVTYKMPEGSTATAPPKYEHDYKVGDSYTVASPTDVSGYTPSQSAVSGVMPAQDVNVTVEYFASAATAYKVYHYIQPLNSDKTGVLTGNESYTLYKIGADTDYETYYGMTDTETAAIAKDLPGFKAQTITQTNITANGEAVVKIYYDRQKFDVTWNAVYGLFDSLNRTFTTQVYYGGKIAPPETPPARDPDNDYTYTFDAWQNWSEGDVMPAENKTYLAQWSQTEQEYTLTVLFKRSDADRVESVPKFPETYTQTLAKGAAYKLELNPTDNTSAYYVQGYTPNQSEIAGTMPTGDVTVTVIYSPNTATKYTVRHFKKNIRQDAYTEATEDTQELSGTTNTMTKASALHYEGFTPESFEQSNIDADGNAEVRVYYTRNLYDVVWDAVEGHYTGGAKTIKTQAEYGEHIAAPTDEALNNAGFTRDEDAHNQYAFDKWLDADNQEFTAIAMPARTVYYHAAWKSSPHPYKLTINYVMEDGHTELAPTQYTAELHFEAAYSQVSPTVTGYTPDRATVSGTMPAADHTITVTYKPNHDTAYTVKYYYQQTTGDEYDHAESQNGTGNGTTNTLTAVTPGGANGFHLSKQEGKKLTQQNIAADGTTVVEVYYDRNVHTVTWDAKEGYFAQNPATENPVKTQTAEYRYGATITPPSISPVRESDNQSDYQFKEWSQFVAGMAMPDSDKTFDATWDHTERKYELSVEYVLENPGSAVTPETYKQSLIVGGKYDVTAPAVPGFTPKTVSPENLYFSSVKPQIKGVMTAEDAPYTVTYQPNSDTPYQVAVYLEQVDGTYKAEPDHTYDAAHKFSDADAVTYQGVTGRQTALTGNEYAYTNYHLDTAEGKGVRNVEILGVDPDGNNQNGTTVNPVVVKIYYARDQFALNWNANGGTMTATGNYTPNGTYRWGTVITAPKTDADGAELTRTGYSFNGWTVALTPADAAVTEIPAHMPAADLTATAGWKAGTHVVTFVPGEGGSISSNGVELTDGNKLTVTYDAKYGKLPRASLSGKVFQGWFTAASGGTKITADTVVKLMEDTTLYAQFGDSEPSGGDGTKPDDSGSGGSSGGGGGGGGGGGAAAPDTGTNDTVTNPDGSKTETVTDEKTGTTTETTTYPDGSVIIKVTDKDGGVTVTETRKDGVKVETTIGKNGDITANVTIPNGMNNVVVDIPVGNPTPGMTAVIVKPDGSEELVNKCAVTETGLRVWLDESATLKVVDNAKQFDDVPAEKWYADAVSFVTSRGLFSGMGDRTFAPDAQMSRAMLMTVLARLDGQDTAGGEQWYSKAMAWAVQTGISDGTNPDGSITREQLAAMLYRFAGSPAVDGGELAFSDADQVSAYAADALRWASGKGIITGKGGGLLDPKGNATRAEVAAMLMRYVSL